MQMCSLIKYIEKIENQKLFLVFERANFIFATDDLLLRTEKSLSFTNCPRFCVNCIMLIILHRFALFNQRATGLTL